MYIRVICSPLCAQQHAVSFFVFGARAIPFRRHFRRACAESERGMDSGFVLV
jgi:hypothetical protein